MGLLQHATKVVKPGRTFVVCMYAITAKVKQLSFYTRLTKEFRSDLQWWHMFIMRWNGISFFHNALITLFDFQIQTDASGSWGCGAYFNGRWLQFPWSAEWAPTSIMAKEMAPVLLSCVVWSRMLLNRSIEFKCDNCSAVEAIRKGSSKDSWPWTFSDVYGFLQPYSIYRLRCHTYWEY